MSAAFNSAEPTFAALSWFTRSRPGRTRILEFYLEDRYVVRNGEVGAQEIVPRAVVVGPRTRMSAELILHGRFDVFTIHFHASGFYGLFRLAMDELADQAYDARSIVGPELSEVEQKLAEASSFEERVRFANDFLLRRLTVRPDAVIAPTANRILLRRGALRVGNAAAEAGIGVRQFERRFRQQVGLPPKLYARIVRFSAALEAKLHEPQRLWTDIAHAFGYHDQMHMIRDFEIFAGESPTAFMRRWNAMPETWE